MADSAPGRLLPGPLLAGRLLAGRLWARLTRPCGRLEPVLTRVVDGRARVAAEIRAAAPLMSALAAPVPARGPWLTAALNAQSARPLSRTRARAVVVEQHRQGGTDGLALLS